MKFYRNEEIEQRAETRLLELVQDLGRPLIVPIPIDHLAENILKLDFLWEPIDELPGETILGALSPHERLIILNETRRNLFHAKPGLERFTKGHEMGHWDLFVDRANLDRPTLFDMEPGGILRRSTPEREVVVLKGLLTDADGRELYRKIRARGDQADEAHAVNRYAAALLMPPALLREAALAIDRREWKNLYRLAEEFGVTMSALTVRLEELDLLCVRDRRPYPSRDEANGQGRWF
jgi:Zn-dependent peptidase ImmA (M78 family)